MLKSILFDHTVLMILKCYLSFCRPNLTDLDYPFWARDKIYTGVRREPDGGKRRVVGAVDGRRWVVGAVDGRRRVVGSPTTANVGLSGPSTADVGLSGARRRQTSGCREPDDGKRRVVGAADGRRQVVGAVDGRRRDVRSPTAANVGLSGPSTADVGLSVAQRRQTSGCREPDDGKRWAH
jgi:hypothetical protein